MTLRPFRDSDAADRAALGRNADIVRSFGGSPDWVGDVVMSLDDAHDWLDRIRRHESSIDRAVEFEGRLIGAVRLHGLSEEDQQATYAVGLFDASLLGQGLGTEVTQLVLDHAFGVLGMHRVGLRVLAFNARAIACYRRCGFREEGRERESARIDGVWHDDVIMGILAREHVK